MIELKQVFHIANGLKFDNGIPQHSILGPLLFHILINKIFFFVEKAEIYNFADDNITYSCEKNPVKIKEDLIYAIKNILKRFRLNSLKLTPESFNL